MKSQPFPSIPHHPWAKGTLGRFGPTFNDQVFDTEQCRENSVLAYLEADEELTDQD